MTASSPSIGSVPVAPPAPGRRVVDAPTRMVHVLLALNLLIAYATGESEHWRALHVTAGYSAAGLVAFWLFAGLLGPRPARAAVLGRKLLGLPGWLRATVQGQALTAAHGRQGQNLLMALVIAALLACVPPLTLSGWLVNNDLGGEWLAELHEAAGQALILLALGHVALVVGLSLLRRRNLARPMLTGRGEGRGPDLVRHNRAALAALVLGAVLGFGAWQWQAAPGGLLPGRADLAAPRGGEPGGAPRNGGATTGRSPAAPQGHRTHEHRD
jgi:cytochrome b